MLRAIVVGFILGFALVGALRLSAGREEGAMLAETSALKPGAAANFVGLHAGCTHAWPVPVLV